jgi:hypothetical protein
MKAVILGEVGYNGVSFSTRYKARFDKEDVTLKECLEWFSQELKKKKKKGIDVNLYYENNQNDLLGHIFHYHEYYISRRFWEEHYGDNKVELLYFDDGWGGLEYTIKLYV